MGLPTHLHALLLALQSRSDASNRDLARELELLNRALETMDEKALGRLRRTKITTPWPDAGCPVCHRPW